MSVLLFLHTVAAVPPPARQQHHAIKGNLSLSSFEAMQVVGLAAKQPADEGQVVQAASSQGWLG